MDKERIIAYMVKEGFNHKLLNELSPKELYRMFILCLVFNSGIVL